MTGPIEALRTPEERFVKLPNYTFRPHYLDDLKGYEGLRVHTVDEAKIKNAAQVPLTLHGGSGTDDEDLRKAIAAGINIIHINTELRVAWRRGLEEGLSKQPNEVVPYKILPFAVESVKEVARSRLKLFNADR
jgi:fructose/tagatose bisphosphate aldolase